VRAARCLVAKEPKPTNTTGSSFFSESVMASIIASIARPAAALGKSAVSATTSMSSDLFTISPYIPILVFSILFFNSPFYRHRVYIFAKFEGQILDDLQTSRHDN
jgi:hypothetical protein